MSITSPCYVNFTFASFVNVQTIPLLPETWQCTNRTTPCYWTQKQASAATQNHCTYLSLPTCISSRSLCLMRPSLE